MEVKVWSVCPFATGLVLRRLIASDLEHRDHRRSRPAQTVRPRAEGRRCFLVVGSSAPPGWASSVVEKRERGTPTVFARRLPRARFGHPSCDQERAEAVLRQHPPEASTAAA